MYVQENLGRQEHHLEQHYHEVLQTLSQKYDEQAAGLEEEKKSKLEALYGQLLACGQALDASKELIEAAKDIYRSQDKRVFLKVPLVVSSHFLSTACAANVFKMNMTRNDCLIFPHLLTGSCSHHEKVNTMLLSEYV